MKRILAFGGAAALLALAALLAWANRPYPTLPEGARIDRIVARAAGEDPGGLIMIHGLPPPLSFVGRLHRLLDWTNGCVAVTNAEIEQIYGAVGDGTPIELRP